MDLQNKNKETSIKWNKDAIYALGLYRWLSSILGIWPSENRIFSKIRIGTFIILQLTTVCIFIERIIVSGNCGTIQEIVDTIVVSISSTQISLKCLLICFQHQKFKRIISSALEDWSNIIDKPSKRIMIKFGYIGRVLFTCQVMTGVATAIPLIMSELPKLKEVPNENNSSIILLRTIPLAPSCWVSITMSSYLYYSYWTSVALYIFCVSMATVSCNLFVYGLGLHVFVQFELLYLSLDTVFDNQSHFQQKKFFKKFVQRHDKILEIANDLEDASTGVILSEVAAIIVVGCVAGVMLLLAQHEGDSETVSAMVVRLVLVFIQLYIYSYMGEKLSAQADKIQDAIYNCPWYAFSPLVAKDLKFIMIRSNYPFYITAGKFLPMNLMSFKAVVKSMFSFFSVLRLMLQD
ncbi:odorant receptor 43a-like [Aphidius gifuensis]|uniref:odorant receptor 43a-like n=1 Tax=Aphidius gifuensis TaxID=684658 RepID=UPI001CDD2281|nr:odorant receptor 43a-like [Aphidius gifuensis]